MHYEVNMKAIIVVVVLIIIMIVWDVLTPVDHNSDISRAIKVCKERGY